MTRNQDDPTMGGLDPAPQHCPDCDAVVVNSDDHEYDCPAFGLDGYVLADRQNDPATRYNL